MSDWAPKVGVVIDLPGDGTAMVDIGNGTTSASLNDATANVALGARVTLLPLEGSYELISIRSFGGAGGVQLGPELVANGGFEYLENDLPEGWSALWDFNTGEPTPLFSTTLASEGSRALGIAAQPEYPHNVIVYSEPFRIDPQVRYRMSMTAMLGALPPAGTTFTVRLSIITGTTAESAAPFGPGSTVTNVTEASPGVVPLVYSGDITAAAGATWACAMLTSTASSPVDLNVYLDAVSLRRRIN